MSIDTVNGILKQLGIENGTDYQFLYDQFCKLRIHTELTFYLIFLLLFLFVITTVYFGYRLRKLEKLLKIKENIGSEEK